MFLHQNHLGELVKNADFTALKPIDSNSSGIDMESAYLTTQVILTFKFENLWRKVLFSRFGWKGQGNRVSRYPWPRSFASPHLSISFCCHPDVTSGIRLSRDRDTG